MDFKVAGTKDGVTGIQMDIKIEGVDEHIMRTALDAGARRPPAHPGRDGQGDRRCRATEMSKYAPRITTITVPVDKIREVIGSGGKVIKDIVAQTGCKIDINDDGKINIASNDCGRRKRRSTSSRASSPKPKSARPTRASSRRSSISAPSSASCRTRRPAPHLRNRPRAREQSSPTT